MYVCMYFPMIIKFVRFEQFFWYGKPCQKKKENDYDSKKERKEKKKQIKIWVSI